MELGRAYVVDASQTTIQALKIIAVICLIILLTAIVKLVQARMIQAPSDNVGRWKEANYQERRNPTYGMDSDQKKKYWRKVASDFDKEFPSSKKTSTSKNSKSQKEVSDNNIKIKKNKNPVAPIIKLKNKKGEEGEK